MKKNIEYELKNKVKSVQKRLELKRSIVGIKFLTFEKEYDDSSADIFSGKTRLCAFVNKANYGERIKVNLDNFSCMGGPQQLGMIELEEINTSGRSLANCGLYSDHSISKEVSNSFMRIPQNIYGLEIGPLEKMDSAEVVIFIGMANQIMKIVQGYTYHYGVPKNFISVGNAAMCSDLTAKPFMRNDINISFMCCGARTSTVSDFGELGVAVPYNKLEKTCKGILKNIDAYEEVSNE